MSETTRMAMTQIAELVLQVAYRNIQDAYLVTLAPHSAKQLARAVDAHWSSLRL